MLAEPSSQPILADAFEYEDRDPKNHNDFVQVGFSDVICEPPTVRSPQCAYYFTKTVFDNTTYATYSLLTLIFGGILSFAYGLTCGVLSFFLIWVATPFLRAWFIVLGLAAKFWLFFVKCFYDPLYESCGKIFSNVNISFSHRHITQNV